MTENKNIKNRQLGGMGTSISDNYYNEDYLTRLNDFETRALEYDKMNRSDPVIGGLLRAIKNPIRSASWGINFKGIDSNKDVKKQKQIEYLEQVFFEDLKFNSVKLNEILTCIEQGYSVFGKIFTIKANQSLGDYISLRMPIRLQKTIQSLKFDDKEDPDKVTALHQFYSNGERSVDEDIPIEDLAVFTLQQIGNDITGISMLRNCIKPFSHKEFIEKMEMIGIERMAIGTPVVELPDQYTPNPSDPNDDLNVMKTQIRNYLGHEKSGMFLPFGWKFKIEEGKMNHTAIKESLNIKTTEMALSFLAQFLLLGQNEKGGAYALGQDQSDFFLSSLEFIANIVIDILNDTAKQLIDIQFGEQSIYPTFFVKGINNKASKEMAETLKTLTDAGHLNPSPEIQGFIRELYKLPGISDNKNQINQPKEKEKTSDKPIKKNEEPPNIKLSELNDYKHKESVFVEAITDNERFIQKTYTSLYEPEIKKFETDLKQILINGYNKAKKEIRDGDEYLSQQGNTGIKNDLKSKVKDQFTKLQNRLLGNKFAGHIMDGAKENATEIADKFFNIQLAYIKAGELNSLVAGHISNIKGVISNEERYVLENIEANFGSGLSLKVIKDQVGIFKINKNIYKLSVTAHPRALFKAEMYNAAKSRDIKFYKLVIPRMVRLDPAGKTISKLFIILTFFEWEKTQSENKKGAGVVNGLGLHQNSQDYYMPIQDNELDIAKERSREQRIEENLLTVTKK